MPNHEVQVIPREHSAMSIRDPESIIRFAIEKGASVETLERMMVVRRELQAEAAKAAFDAAMRDFQAECPVIVKGKSVPDKSGRLAYRYAPFEDILAQIRPLLHKHGFSYTLDTDVKSEAGWVIAQCVVTHCAGHSHESTAKFPLSSGTAIMSTTQIYAAALTFASRRVFCNAFGIVTGGEDTDGRTTAPRPSGPSTMAPDKPSLKPLVAELWSVLSPVRGDKRDWIHANQWLWKNDILDGAIPEEAPHLTADRLRDVITKSRVLLSRRACDCQCEDC